VPTTTIFTRQNLYEPALQMMTGDAKKLLIRDCSQGRSFLARLDSDVEIVGQITDLAKDMGIEAAFISAIGALTRADLGYYYQAAREYHVTPVEEPVELAACSGNISLLEGRPFVHAHAVLANGKGSTWAGHLVRGSIFAAELYLQELPGSQLHRTLDIVTGLNLWTQE
jgi:predicted DNA-binding protein with PD1-like motif